MKLPRIGDTLLPAERAQHIGRLIGLCALLGVLAGFGAILFELLTGIAKHWLLDGLAGYRPEHAAGDVELFSATSTPFRTWVLALLPVAGGLVGGAIVLALAPEAEGHGTDAVIEAYHHKRGTIRAIVPFVKTVASAITLGCGGSAGREGPIAQIGAGVGSMLASRLRLGARERRILLMAGLAAGVGAIFRAPLAAALFAAEVLYREMDMEFEVIVPATIASIVSYSVFTIALGQAPLFATPAFRFDDPRELLPYTLLAFAVAAGAKILVRVLYGVRDAVRSLRIPRLLKPTLGGVGVGAVALVMPGAIGGGYGIVQQALLGAVPARTLLALALLKIAATSLTVGSGQSGGVFGPAVVIGAFLGGAVGHAGHWLAPALVPQPGAFVLVGMAGFFAAAANAPISTIIMVSEMTGSYGLLVPAMWVSTIAYLLVRRSTLYENQLARRADSPVHLGEMLGSVLGSLSVRDALRDAGERPLVTVRRDTGLGDLLARFSETQHACFPIVDDAGHLHGVVDDRALRQAVGSDAGLQNAVVAADLAEDAPLLTLGESLHSAMRKMVITGHAELVVVDEADPGRPIGALSRRDLIHSYDQHVQRHRGDERSCDSSRRWRS